MITLVVDLYQYEPYHTTYTLLVKTNNIIIRYRNIFGTKVLKSHIQDLDIKLDKGTIERHYYFWFENLLNGFIRWNI
jgi:hypothetical protein